jgi:CRP-like cAMP-binding protein
MENTAFLPIKNRILAALPQNEYQRLLPSLESVPYASGDIFYEIDGTIEHAYFPSSALISLVTQMEDGKIIEVGLVGNDGMSGIAALLGQTTSAERAIVQIPGDGLRAKISVIKEEFQRGGQLQHILMRYIYTLMRQVSQTAACNAAHTAEERLSRWLLMCRDRVSSDDFNLTQEFIAEMLGTRRATVNVAAITLQSADLIRYHRGHLRIIDRQGLESFSCECYEALKKATDGRDGNSAHGDGKPGK